ncbi:putative response regulator receiver protein [Sinorhizobium fredii NGR234]|uniref:Response regulator receiver protein n=1 Tax=Sinorhizobium fredii (strain NBRC 101917 / NGR234) TaxID=394 RepID=C3MC18_SINFN|nr:response regulator [Sinorhizobium fredii]ACP27243.1 putative response regulator receiver protein [Sinorhizobium fredii NGR234]
MERKANENQLLCGARVLIAEDEVLIALDIEAAFRDAGAEVLSPCMTLSAALDAARNEAVSLAVLDVRLGRETTEDVSDVLAERGIPFLFYSGQRLPAEMQEKCRDAVMVDKPASQQDLVDAAAKLLAA